jgi:uncharacterized protein (DUF58 family)
MASDTAPADPRFDPSALARFGDLGLVARTVVEGFLSGVHQSPYKGFSVEFAEHRQYYPGDEIRHIDWRAVGKTDRYYIKEHEEETNLQAHLLVDASGSMAYAGRGVSKFAYARFVAASLAYLLLHQRDAVGLVTHDHAVREILPPRSHAKQLPLVLRTLDETRPGGETALADVWHRVAPQLRRRGLVVILSDCFDRPPPLLHALRRLAHAGHEVILFHVLAPEEIEFPFDRFTQFRGLERPADTRLVDPHLVRQEYLRNFEAFCHELRTGAAGMRIDYHLLRTDQPVDRALGHYLSRRRPSGAAR